MKEEVLGGRTEAVEALASPFARALSPEIVSAGEIEAMAHLAEEMLELDGEESLVNGMPALVTLHYARTKIDDTTYYVRVFRPLDTPDEMPGIVFDLTEDTVVHTPNMYAVRFKDLASSIALVVDDDLNPHVNDPKEVEQIKAFLGEISEKVGQAQIEQRQQANDLEDQKRQSRHNHVRDIAHRVGRYSFRVFAIAAALGLVYGATHIDYEPVKRVFRSNRDKFDEVGHSLDDGQIIPLGGEASPQFSLQLYDDKSLSVSNMPRMMSKDANQNDMMMVDDGLREVVITSPEGRDSCTIIKVEKAAHDAVLKAWTDFAGANGVSRADELTVTYSSDEIKACWHGQERNPNDDPRIVYDIYQPTPGTR